eukprot:59324-Rhodomonas_salina.2
MCTSLTIGCCGVQQAVLVVVFLSDLYLKSINCLFEFRVAAASGVYLLPVLVRGWSGEYGGPQDAEWWHHAEKTAGLCSTAWVCHDAGRHEARAEQTSPLEVGQEGAHKGWAALAATTPLDFRKVDPTKEDTDEEQQLIRRYAPGKEPESCKLACGIWRAGLARDLTHKGCDCCRILGRFHRGGGMKEKSAAALRK